MRSDGEGMMEFDPAEFRRVPLSIVGHICDHLRYRHGDAVISNDLAHDIAGALVEYRFRAKLSQEELADKAQLSVRALRNIERGYTRYPHINSVRRLAVALQLTDDEGEILLRMVDRPILCQRQTR
ncbi:helix-turn-helix domain-containing protein [Nocardia fluminea]|uniref:helix-turn-helix domain-containing protein n=1 Tax=Nocardia fluminea TaxID=134984 RepID=UPI00365B386C